MMTLRMAALAAVLTASAATCGYAATKGDDGSVTTTPTSPSLSAPNTFSHDGSNQLGANGNRAGDSPGAAASPHTGYSSGMTPGAGTGSGTADGTTDTGATSPGSGQAAKR